jgi:hypothetical protein
MIGPSEGSRAVRGRSGLRDSLRSVHRPRRACLRRWRSVIEPQVRKRGTTPLARRVRSPSRSRPPSILVSPVPTRRRRLRDLARISLCRAVYEARPTGFEPVTFGSVDRTRLAANPLRRAEPAPVRCNARCSELQPPPARSSRQKCFVRRGQNRTQWSPHSLKGSTRSCVGHARSTGHPTWSRLVQALGHRLSGPRADASFGRSTARSKCQ